MIKLDYGGHDDPELEFSFPRCVPWSWLLQEKLWLGEEGGWY
jgi:hypothetical protein